MANVQPSIAAARTGYDDQRPQKIPPHVPIRYVRLAAGLTLDEVIGRIEEETGRRYTRGAISAVENGHRGASNELVEALEIAYGIPHGSIDTLYRPRPRRSEVCPVEGA